MGGRLRPIQRPAAATSIGAAFVLTTLTALGISVLRKSNVVVRKSNVRCRWRECVIAIRQVRPEQLSRAYSIRER
jgi:hypothetical protein